MSRRRFVAGFVVKREFWEEDLALKKRVKRRVEVSRLYSSHDAAQTLLELLKKQNPDRAAEYYVHEKNTRDDAEIY